MKGLTFALCLVAVVAVARADSLNCREVGAWTQNYGLSVAVDLGRNLAYLGSSSEVSVLDIVNPAHPTKHSRVEASGGIWDPFPRSDRLYFTEDVSGLLEVWDVADPKAPVRLGDHTTGAFPAGVWVEGSHAYVADGESCLFVIDVSDPESTREVGRYRPPAVPGRVAVAGSYAYVTLGEAGLIVIDVSNPQNPRGVGRYNTPGVAHDVAVAGIYAYVADAWDSNGLRIIDASDPQRLKQAGYCPTPGIAFGVAVAGSYAYVADEADGGLRVIDVSDPRNPTEVGFYDTPGAAAGVAVAGNYAYVADYTGGLRIIEFYGGGVEEAPGVGVRPANRPSIVRGSLLLSSSASSSPSWLLDEAGRKVMDLRVGENDVRHLAPGVYFVREHSAVSGHHSGPPAGSGEPSAVRRVIVTR